TPGEERSAVWTERAGQVSVPPLPPRLLPSARRLVTAKLLCHCPLSPALHSLPFLASAQTASLASFRPALSSLIADRPSSLLDLHHSPRLLRRPDLDRSPSHPSLLAGPRTPLSFPSYAFQAAVRSSSFDSPSIASPPSFIIMSDESFAAIDAMLQEEVSASTALVEENAHLRALLAERDATKASHDASTLLAQLEAVRAEKEKLATQVRELREAQVASVALEDQSNEVSVLRSSLADLALQLEAERTRAAEAEARRREEEEKVNTLRAKVEESRRAIMRLQNEANKRPSIDQGYSFPPRRKSFLVDSAIPRRRSSLGLNAIAASQAAGEIKDPSNPGLGLAVESPLAPPISLLSTSPSRTSTATPLARLAHRRGSASIAIQADGLDDDDQRLLRLRELRLGVHSTKIASRRNSAVSGLPDFFQPEDFEWDLERSLARRTSACSISRRLGVDPDGPPSANFRMLGRKNSTAVFESWSRRSSSADSMCSLPTDPSHASPEHLANLKLQLEGLKIQLAEAEEGRRASEACLRALKDFIANGSTGEAPISLPPLPTDPSADSYGEGAECPPAPKASSSRWSIPRLSFSSQRRESTASSLRRTSTTSTASAATFLDNRPTPSLPSFGAFSFSALVNKSSATLVDGDTSPRMSRPATLTPFSSHHEETFPTEPSPLLSGGSSVRSRHVGHSPSASLDDAASIAPSLVSDLSSCGASSRSASPTHEDEHDGQLDAFQRSPRVVIDFVNDQEPPFVFSPDADCASQRVVVEASRMPVVVGKSSLTTLSSIAARTTGLGLH
ncbi:hypothetical protein RTBOTA2_004542, partial [Rhodotorula toruloides]